MAAVANGPQEYTEYMVSRYKARRDRLVADLNVIPGVRCDLPQGAFYVFPDITGTGLSSLAFTERLLEGGGGGCHTGGCLRSGWRWIRAPLLCRFR